MALDVSALAEYVNEHAMELMAASVAAGKTVDQVTIQSGMKHKDTINILATGVTFAADGCSFSGTDTTAITQRVIEVEEIKVDEVMCPKDLNTKYLNTMLQAGSDDDSIPFEALYIEQKGKVLADELEKADWQGQKLFAAGNLGFYDGFLKVIDDSASAIDGNVDAVTVATGITDANALDIVKGMYQSIPVEILGESDIKCFVGWDTFRALICNITNDNLFHYNTDGAMSAGEIVVPGTGLTVVAVNGLTGTDRLIAGRTSNFYIGMDAASDESVKMWYSQDDQNLKSTIRFKRGVQVAFPDEIVEFTLVP